MGSAEEAHEALTQYCRRRSSQPPSVNTPRKRIGRAGRAVSTRA